MKKLYAIVIIIVLTSIGVYAQQYNLIIKVKDLKIQKEMTYLSYKQIIMRFQITCLPAGVGDDKRDL